MGTYFKEIARIPIVVNYSIRAATVISLALFFAGCGSGGGEGRAPAASNVVVASSPALQTDTVTGNSFIMTSDNYGMQKATYLASGKSSLGIVLRAAIASSMTDPSFKTVSRIDIPPSAAIGTARVYSLGAATATAPVFPGEVYFLNGFPSTQLKTVDGTITFTAFGDHSGDRISGSFSAVVEDGNDSATPKARYTVAADFEFVTDSDGPVSPVIPSLAAAGGVPSADGQGGR